MVGSGWEWVGMDGSGWDWVGVGGSGWDWVGLGGSKWEWMGVGGGGWEWVGVLFSITLKEYNPNKTRKISIVFDDMIADVLVGLQ